MIDHTANGRSFKILNIIDEYTRECLSIKVNRSIKSQDVIEELFNLFIFRGIPEHIRSDNGPEFTAKAVRKWLNRLGVRTLFIEPGSPWENGYIESFNGKLRVYVVSESGTMWAFKVTDTLEATALFPGGSIIVPSYL